MAKAVAVPVDLDPPTPPSADAGTWTSASSVPVSRTPQIYEALVAVGAELARVGVAKARVNEQQHFRFRGIDDVMNTVSAILPKHHIVFLPRYSDHTTVDRPTTDGKKSLIYATVTGEFTFVSATDGSYVGVSTFGEAMDSGDKALNKAMSAALKYALLQTFLIPTESNEDADATTPEETRPAPPQGFKAWFAEMMGLSDEGYARFTAAWAKGDKPCREYAVAYHKDELTRAKEHATEVSAELDRRAAELRAAESEGA